MPQTKSDLALSGSSKIEDPIGFDLPVFPVVEPSDLPRPHAKPSMTELLGHAEMLMRSPNFRNREEKRRKVLRESWKTAEPFCMD